MNIVDVALHISSRATAMALLKSTPRPVSDIPYAELNGGFGYEFTAVDIEEFLSARRPDVVELIVSTTANVNLLYDVCDLAVPASVLKAVCRNTRAPADLLMLLYSDPRKGVVAAARSALAQRMRIRVRTADSTLTQLRELVFGPDADVAPLLARFYRSGPQLAAEYATQAVLERPTHLSDETWKLISAGDWSRIGHFSGVPFIASLVRHPRITTEDLQTIWPRMRYRVASVDVGDALLDRFEPGSDAWFDVVWTHAEGSHSKKLKEHAKFLTLAQAYTMANRGGPTRERLAFESGHFTAEAVRERAKRWLDHPKSPLPSPRVLESPALAGELLEAALVRANSQRDAFIHLQCNPALPESVQLEWLNSDRGCTPLASSAHFTRSAAELLVSRVTQFAESSVNMFYMPWSTSTAVLALFANGSVDEDVRLSIPAGCLTQGSLGWAAYGPAYFRSVEFLDEKLGGGPEAWKAFLGLLPEWEGSVGDLVRVVTVLS